jgi:hypothetical protein
LCYKVLSSKPSIFVVDQVAIDVARFWVFFLIVDQIVASKSTNSILMLLGFGPFVFVVDQITPSTSILMLLGFWAFLLLLIKLQQLFVVLWAFLGILLC